MGKGNCLNYLGSSKFDINGPRLSSSTAVPKAVKRIHEIYEKPTFLVDVNGSDIKQGFLGNCWLIASLSALANVKDGIRRICVEYDTREWTTVPWRGGGATESAGLTHPGNRHWHLRLRLLPRRRVGILHR